MKNVFEKKNKQNNFLLWKPCCVVYSSMKKNQWNEKGIGWFLTKKNYFEGQNSAALELQF